MKEYVNDISRRQNIQEKQLNKFTGTMTAALGLLSFVVSIMYGFSYFDFDRFVTKELHQTNKIIYANLTVPNNSFTVAPCTGFYRRKCNKLNNNNDTDMYTKTGGDRVYNDLVRLLNHKTLSLVGDSLSRQWFETLSCFFGLTQHWFLQKNGHTPQTYNAQKAGITPLHILPKGASKVYGYATALSKHQNFAINYYHLDHYNKSFLPYINKQQQSKSMANIVVINLGLHYHDQDQYTMDLQNLFRQFHAYEKNDYYYDQTIHLFRETSPQHFVHDAASKHEEENGLYLANDTRVCGQISNKIQIWYNQIANKLAIDANITVMKVEYALKPLWSYHIGTDCTHYCSNNVVWHNLHESLLNTLQTVM